MNLLPDQDTMYAAIVNRDTSLDGVFVVGVRTTGVFCRPGCGARKPRRENVEFFRGPHEALHAGYRPCKRCRPMEHGSNEPAWVRTVLDLAERHSGQRLTSRDVRAAGVDPSRAARYFKSRYGLTVQGYHRARRMGSALQAVRAGATVTKAAMAAGFASESGFRDAFSAVFASTPATAVSESCDVVRVVWMESPLGPLLAGATDDGVCLLEFVDRRALESQIGVLRRRFKAAIVPGAHPVLTQLAHELEAYFRGRSMTFSVPLSTRGTPFQRQVWDALIRIPAGQTRSYARIAGQIGRPTALRAVARANGDNRMAILIPCHRVIGSDGSLTGYGGGIWRKKWLLDHERQHTGDATLFGKR